MSTRTARTSSDVSNIGRTSSLGTKKEPAEQTSPTHSKTESLQRLKNMAASRLNQKPSANAGKAGEGLISSKPSGASGSRPSSAARPKDASSAAQATRPPSSRGQAIPSIPAKPTVQPRSRIPTSSTSTAGPTNRPPSGGSSAKLFEPSSKSRDPATTTTGSRTAAVPSRSSAPQVLSSVAAKGAEAKPPPAATRTSVTGRLGALSVGTGNTTGAAQPRPGVASSMSQGQASSSGVRPPSRQKAGSVGAASASSAGTRPATLLPSTSGRVPNSHSSAGLPARDRVKPATPPHTGSQSYGASIPDEAPPPEAAGPLMECPSCGRCFNEMAYPKHVKVCDKVFNQKRKQFNSTAARLAGTEAAQFVDKPKRSQHGLNKGSNANSGAGRAPPKARHHASDDRPIPKTQENSKAAWKAKSEAFRAAMQASRMISEAQARGEDIRNLALPKALETPDDRVPCPHCGRKFAALTAERHIPKCKETVAKPSVLRAGGGKGAHMRNAPGKAAGRR